MFEVIKEMFTEENEAKPCYALQCKKHSLYVPAFTTSLKEAANACALLNSADTDRINLIYIIEDMVLERSLIRV